MNDLEALKKLHEDIAKIKKLADFTKLEPLEALVLRCAERIEYLERTLQLEQRWDEGEYSFFADFVVSLNTRLITLVLDKTDMTMQELDELLFGERA